MTNIYCQTIVLMTNIWCQNNSINDEYLMAKL